METKTSLLMADSSESDCQKETMLDFILSWTLRRAQVCYANEDTLLYKYCRKILFHLLGIEEYDNIEVISVETWKQWYHIDLHANIGLRINGEIEWHALLVENKIYSPIHDNQLKRYKEIFEETYRNGEFKDHLHFVLITCLETPTDNMQKECDDNNYMCVPILKLFPYDYGEDTKSDIFNEFWLRKW